MPRHSPCALISLTFLRLTVDFHFLVLYSWIMQAHVFWNVYSVKQKLYFYPFKIIYPLLLPSHNCIIISFNVQFSRCIFESFIKTQWSTSLEILQSIFMVEISGIEPLTSCLQGRRSPSWAKPPYPFCCAKWWAKDSLSWTRSSRSWLLFHFL